MAMQAGMSRRCAAGRRWRSVDVHQDAGPFFELIQHESGWIDTTGYNFVAVTAQVYGADATLAAGSSFLFLDTAASVEGPWTPAATFLAASGAQEAVLTTTMPFNQRVRLQRYLRWRWYTPTAVATYYVSFQMRVSMKP